MKSPSVSCLIIDDDYNSCRWLSDQISQSALNFSIVGSTTNPFEGKYLVEKESPQVVFLDIEMPGINGFELLETLNNRNFWVVFVTSYSQYAIRALKMQALDYLVKPVEGHDLQLIYQSILNRTMLSSPDKSLLHSSYQSSLNRLSANYSQPVQEPYLTVAHSKGIRVIRFSELIYLKASGPYCEFHLEGEKFTASKTMKYFEELLPSSNFIKIHKSYIINLAFLKEYVVDAVGYAHMVNGDKLEISRRRKDTFLNRIKQ